MESETVIDLMKRTNFRADVVYYEDNRTAFLYIVATSGKYRHFVRKYTADEVRAMFEDHPGSRYFEFGPFIEAEIMRHAAMAWPTN